jgi:AcrR family transcriptional regulator
MTAQRHAPSPHDRILDAAAQVFAEQGFAGARVDEIARRAGVNKAMLYYHVGDKTRLYETVLERNFDRVLQAVHKAAASASDSRQQLALVIESFARTIATIPEHPRIMLREFAGGATGLPEPVLYRVAGVFKAVHAVLSGGVAAGELRPTNPLLTHIVIVAAVVFSTAIQPFQGQVTALLPELLAEDDAAPPPSFVTDPAELAAAISDLLLNGLASTSPVGGSS